MHLDIKIESLLNHGVSLQVAKDILARLEKISSGPDPATAWHDAISTVLTPDVPFEVHREVFDAIFADWDDTRGPQPAWSPDAAEADATNIMAFCRDRNIDSYEALYAWSVSEREAFWQSVVEQLGVRFREWPRRILDLEGGVEDPGWLSGARLNIAESCFQAPGDQTAIVYQPEGGPLSTITYTELDRLSNRVANGIEAFSLPRGSAIAIAMPMTVEAVAAYLGIVKAGCTVVSIADSFSADEIATRLRIADAQAVVTQDVILRAGKTLPMYDRVVAAGAMRAIVVPAIDSLQVMLRDTDVQWDTFLSDTDNFEAIACAPDDAVNVLFSSGTTGDPKAIPWTHATPIKCAMDGYFHQDIKPGEVVAWPTNIGWMMGPWLIFASLMNRATVALYYGAPGTREFCRFVQDAGVHMLGVVPSLVKAWRAAATVTGFDWTGIKLFSSTGEASNSDDYLYLMSLAGYRPVVEYCGGTEIGGGYIAGTLVQSASPATFSTPTLGLSFHILDEEGHPSDAGELYLVPPSIGLSARLLNRDHHDVYYRGTPAGPAGELLRRHGDQMQCLPGGYFQAHGRADDTMNLSGIKVSSSEIERSLAAVDGLVESAAIAVSPPGGGPSQLVVYAVMAGDGDKDELKRSMQSAIATVLNPLFKLHDVIVIDALPRTASNKVMRRVLRSRYKYGDT
jgi:acetyl-CoA synthetase